MLPVCCLEYLFCLRSIANAQNDFFVCFRDEDRDILVDLKMKGPSSKTFVALSTKLKKSPAQVLVIFIGQSLQRCSSPRR